MNNPMRLFNRKGVWHVEFAGGKRRSLRTPDAATAKGIFKELEKEYLRGRLLRLDNTKRISISEFSSAQIKFVSSGVFGQIPDTISTPSASLVKRVSLSLPGICREQHLPEIRPCLRFSEI